MHKLNSESGEAIEHKMINRSIENAQRKVEGHNFDIRKNLLEYDDVSNDQRQVIYQQRRELMDSKDISETISQAYGAAGRAINLLSKDSVSATGAVCGVNETSCVACQACMTACTYDAIDFYDTPLGKKARVNPVLCKGDGLCNAKCPTGAIYLNHYTENVF